MPDANDIQRRLQANEDPYSNPASGVLTNKVGAHTQADLDAAEDTMVEARTLELAVRPLPATFDEQHLKAIHRHLFQDIYSWAGERRTVNTSKPDDPAAFFPCQRFDFGAPATFEQLRDRRFKPGMPHTEFVAKLTATYDEINHLHLFREGNGRTQRIFLSQLAQHCGHVIGWAKISASDNDQICRAAGHGDTAPMRAALSKIVTDQPIDDAKTALSLLHHSHPSADRSRTTEPGPSTRARRQPENVQQDELER